MAMTLIRTKPDLDTVNHLLDRSLPAYRKAYSDRTAWLTACLSQLAYIRFNPVFSGDKQKRYFLENISKLVDKLPARSVAKVIEAPTQEQKAEREKIGKEVYFREILGKLIDQVGYDDAKEMENLKEELGSLRLEMVEPFDENGTQAILVSNQSYLFLAFRGTEAMSIKDIKADAKAYTEPCETGGRIHVGFRDAYNEVGLKIQSLLDKEEYKAMPLFITGHSLGGALATIAAKKLDHKGGIAACYTFGAPRVGNDKWISDIKAPVYRLVNAADCVTMLPPGSETIDVLAWLVQFIPGVGRYLRSILLSQVSGYLHGGHMRYLTNCPKGDFKDVQLLYHVSLFYRLKGLIIKKLPWRKFLSDHSIDVYRRKLQVVAWRRNK